MKELNGLSRDPTNFNPNNMVIDLNLIKSIYLTFLTVTRSLTHIYFKNEKKDIILKFQYFICTYKISTIIHQSAR